MKPVQSIKLDGHAPQPAKVEARPVLELVNLAKRYASTGTIAVTDVTLTLRSGEFVSLLGPSGCGKSTAMKLGAGLIEKSAGVIRYNGVEQNVTPGQYGIVFQQPTLLPWWNVEENILLPARVLGLDLAKARQRAEHLLSLVGLQGKNRQYPSELSGGMQQRVAIARALLHEPKLLFMDEPFGALDAITRERLNFELLDIQEKLGLTVLFVTHGISEAVLLSNRVVIMSSSPGRIVGELEINLKRPRTADVLDSSVFHEMEGEVRSRLNQAERQRQ
jgi:NitT/TauT family transport system ATP-binding protein